MAGGLRMQVEKHKEFGARSNRRSRVTRRLARAVSTLLMAAGAVVATGTPAQAHHPVPVGTWVCNESTGLFDITWSVASWAPTNGIRWQLTDTTPDLTYPAGWQSSDYQYVLQQPGVQAGTYTLRASAKWANGNTGARTSAAVSPSGPCARTQPPAPAPSIQREPFREESCEIGGVNTWERVTRTDWVFDTSTWTWVPAEPVVTVSDKVFTPYDDATYALLCAPTRPAERVVEAPWQDETWACNDTTTTQTRTVTRTPYVWDAGARVWVPGVSTVITQTRTRELTPQEQYVCPRAAKPAVKLDTRCTRTTYITMDNRRSDVAVRYQVIVKRKGKVLRQQSFVVEPGTVDRRVWKVRNRAKVWALNDWQRKMVKVPARCARTPEQPPKTGHRTT